ncbi:MAG: DeoR/GlpR transcriptional regulator [Verrucomicrobia bacterium]|nr:MAG: DeoR/GlpR transcriptional regulator [Verrucomicrobiota bacterium]
MKIPAFAHPAPPHANRFAAAYCFRQAPGTPIRQIPTFHPAHLPKGTNDPVIHFVSVAYRISTSRQTCRKPDVDTRIRIGKYWFFLYFFLFFLISRWRSPFDRAVIPQQRQRNIVETIHAQGAARTIDLAERFSVTVETIRRDLEILHSEGLLVRTHGGAIAIDHPTRQQTAGERQIQNLARKRALARRAVEMIQPRDIVFLDASSTTLQIAEQLPDLELTVLTNSLDALEVLATRTDINLVGTGGHLVSDSRAFVGHVAIATLRRYHIQKFFFSGNGIDLKRGISETSEEQAGLKAEVLRLAEEAIFLSDDSKLNHRAAFFFAQLEQVDCWLTTPPQDPRLLDPYRNKIRRIELVPAPPDTK